MNENGKQILSRYEGFMNIAVCEAVNEMSQGMRYHYHQSQ